MSRNERIKSPTTIYFFVFLSLHESSQANAALSIGFSTMSLPHATSDPAP